MKNYHYDDEVRLAKQVYVCLSLQKEWGLHSSINNPLCICHALCNVLQATTPSYSMKAFLPKLYKEAGAEDTLDMGGLKCKRRELAFWWNISPKGLEERKKALVRCYGEEVAK